MPAHITMALYTGIVLECQHCYRICRWSEATVRRNCPSCGLEIGNWQALTDELAKREAPNHETPQE
jgi:hypothetical protein